MVGGVMALYHVFPFMVEIFLRTYNVEPKHICGGSLITMEWVLTAAHCRHEGSKYIYYVGAGRADNVYRIFDTGTIKFLFGQTRRSRQFYQHEDYNDHTIEHDIALMKLEEPFTADSSIAPVKLPLYTEPGDLTKLFKVCYIAGWGKVGPNIMQIFDHSKSSWIYNEDVRKLTKLVHVVLPVISNDQCRRIFDNYSGISFDVKDTQLCTLYYPGRKSVCRGDSGGPLICGSTQYGVTSYSFSCGKPRVGADVYTRVDKFLDWINDTVRNHSRLIRSKSPTIFDLDYYVNPDIEVNNNACTTYVNIVILVLFCLLNLMK